MALFAKYIHEFATDESASTYNYDLHNFSIHVSREQVEVQSGERSVLGVRASIRTATAADGYWKLPSTVYYYNYIWLGMGKDRHKPQRAGDVPGNHG